MRSPSPGDRLAFTVDTHLFRELGKLLVGRDSTALIELVKNAYDADATTVILHAEGLGTRHGSIKVTDNGTGMTYDVFRDSFLRIAGRSKTDGRRRSQLYGRRFTGAKGIGRLSAYKLAEVLAVESTPAGARHSGVSARIDWSALENATGDIHDTDLVEARRVSPSGSDHGTDLTLTRLRLATGNVRSDRFLREIRATRPDPVLFRAPSRRELDVDLLVPVIGIADADTDAPFDIELSGDLDPGAQPWPSLIAAMHWVIEIDARTPTVTYRVSPTALQRTQQPAARPHTFTFRRGTGGPLFNARIFARAPKATAAASRLPDLLERFSKEVSGIRIYMEGFQVLPYGHPGNDWLEIDRDRARRGPLRYEDPSLPDSSATDARIYQLNNQNYIGAVFLHEESAGGLEMVVNREGFLPGPAMDEITDTVRRGIDLAVRVRAALGAADREEARALEQVHRRETLRRHQASQGHIERSLPASTTETPGSSLNLLVDAARGAVAELRASGAPMPIDQEALTLVRAALDETHAAIEGVRDEQAQLRVLASVGTQFGAFIHEVNGLLGQARIVLQLIDELLRDESVGKQGRARLRAVHRATIELVASLERQAIYLTDTIGAEARKRRSRQKLSERFTTAMRLLGLAAKRRDVNVASHLDESLRTPPMFPAEVNVVLTNLLSNAIKAAGSGGQVVVNGREGDGLLSIRVENTGAAVDPEDGERWFRPFETTTADIDDTLGQGMGLGLPLTRRIIEEYGGEISFVSPGRGFATAIEVRLPVGRG